MKALEKDRNRRYESAGRFATDITNLLTNNTIDARPPSLGYRLLKAWRRNQLVYSFSVSIFLVLLFALTYFIYSSERNRALATSLRSELVDRAVNQSANGELDSALEAIDQLESIGTSFYILEILECVAHATVGDSTTAMKTLERMLEADPDANLPKLILVWTCYDAGEGARAAMYFGGLRNLVANWESDIADTEQVEADLAKLYRARFRTYLVEDESAVQLFADVLQNNPQWGLGYMFRAEVRLECFRRTRSVDYLQEAMYDAYVASVLLPSSDLAKGYSLKLYVHALQYAQAFPDGVHESSRRSWTSKGERLATHFVDTLTSWDGAAYALAYYRTTDQPEKADQLERRIEAEFSHLQTIRDGDLFVEKNNKGFLGALSKEQNWFTRQNYALLLFEQGDRVGALRELNQAIHDANGNLDALNWAAGIAELIGETDLQSKVIAKIQAPNTWDVWWWQKVIADFHCGEISEDDFLDQAHPFGETLAAAHFFVGTSHLAKGEREKARIHFHDVIDTGRIG